jgi:hypothetical protein
MRIQSYNSNIWDASFLKERQQLQEEYPKKLFNELGLV